MLLPPLAGELRTCFWCSTHRPWDNPCSGIGSVTTLPRVASGGNVGHRQVRLRVGVGLRLLALALQVLLPTPTHEPSLRRHLPRRGIGSSRRKLRSFHRLNSFTLPSITAYSSSFGHVLSAEKMPLVMEKGRQRGKEKELILYWGIVEGTHLPPHSSGGDGCCFGSLQGKVQFSDRSPISFMTGGKRRWGVNLCPTTRVSLHCSLWYCLEELEG